MISNPSASFDFPLSSTLHKGKSASLTDPISSRDDLINSRAVPKLADHDLYLSVTALGELYAGAAKSARPERNKNGVRDFLETCTLLHNDEPTAARYGEEWAALARAGKMIPTNDIWIAASALQHGLKLISNDSHFRNIDGLDHESW